MVLSVKRCRRQLLGVSLKLIREENGSLAPLVIGLFLIVSLTSISVVDFSSVILKQRILDQNNERALQRAAHEIDLGQYYTHGLDQYSVSKGAEKSEYRIPIDCKKAYQTYWEELFSSINSKEFESSSEVISTQIQYRNGWRIESFNCDGNTISARVFQHTPLPFQLPIFGIYEATIQASASAYSATN